MFCWETFIKPAFLSERRSLLPAHCLFVFSHPTSSHYTSCIHAYTHLHCWLDWWPHLIVLLEDFCVTFLFHLNTLLIICLQTASSSFVMADGACLTLAQICKWSCRHSWRHWLLWWGSLGSDNSFVWPIAGNMACSPVRFSSGTHLGFILLVVLLVLRRPPIF